MPEIPIIIPVVVAGLAVGSVIKSKSPRISKKKLASASLVAGLLNAVHAYLLYLFARGLSVQNLFILPSSELAFVMASLLAGFLIVFAILGIAVAYARIRKGEELEVTELSSEEESMLKAG